MADKKQESMKKNHFGGCFSGFGIAGRDLAGVDRSGRGFNPRPAQDESIPEKSPPTQQRKLILCRSGVAPPTGKLHPRENRGTADKKQESMKKIHFGGCFSGFGIAGRDLAGVDRSGRGFNPRPAQENRPRRKSGRRPRKLRQIVRQRVIIAAVRRPNVPRRFQSRRRVQRSRHHPRVGQPVALPKQGRPAFRAKTAPRRIGRAKPFQPAFFRENQTLPRNGGRRDNMSAPLAALSAVANGNRAQLPAQLKANRAAETGAGFHSLPSPCILLHRSVKVSPRYTQ